MESHVRIDEGIKRGAVQPAAAWPQRKPPTAGKLGPNFDATTVLERYLQGEEIADIADSLNVHPKALNYHLLKPDIREAWRQAQVAVSLAENQESKEVVRQAPDALSLARARETLRSSQWDLERLENRLFGQQQTAVNINASGPLQVQIVSYVTPAAHEQGQVIDNTSEPTVQQSVAPSK